MVTLKTSKGDIIIELDHKNAPETVHNFVQYVRDKFYDGTIFHRVIDGFMIQGGGFEPGMKQKQTRNPIKNEADNGLENNRGTIAMARTADPHSATAQFFINIFDNHSLNYSSPTPQGWGYCVFGQVVQGMDIVDIIRDVETGNRTPHADVPVEDIIIESATVTDED